MNSSPNSTVSRLRTKLATLFRPKGKETPLQPEKKTKKQKKNEAVTENCSLKGLIDQADINNFVSLIPALTNYFTLRADCFKAGQLVDYVDNWKLITSDQESGSETAYYSLQ